MPVVAECHSCGWTEHLAVAPPIEVWAEAHLASEIHKLGVELKTFARHHGM